MKQRFVFFRKKLWDCGCVKWYETDSFPGPHHNFFEKNQNSCPLDFCSFNLCDKTYVHVTCVNVSYHGKLRRLYDNRPRGAKYCGSTCYSAVFLLTPLHETDHKMNFAGDKPNYGCMVAAGCHGKDCPKSGGGCGKFCRGVIFRFEFKLCGKQLGILYRMLSFIAGQAFCCLCNEVSSAYSLYKESRFPFSWKARITASRQTPASPRGPQRGHPPPPPPPHLRETKGRPRWRSSC